MHVTCRVYRLGILLLFTNPPNDTNNFGNDLTSIYSVRTCASAYQLQNILRIFPETAEICQSGVQAHFAFIAGQCMVSGGSQRLETGQRAVGQGRAHQSG